MGKVAIGLIGTGTMGAGHAKRIVENVPDAELKAVCDAGGGSAAAIAEQYRCRSFSDHRILLSSGIVDAVLIATPHYSHTPIGIDALNAGVHVLMEKPIAVHKADCERLLAAHVSDQQVFGAMFNVRTMPVYQALKRIIDNGELGNITRVNWIVTTWFRTDQYYRSAGWRATWRGEGGGVLLNQCPHQLDILQWICGMPEHVRAFVGVGKYHRIEVEDEVTAVFEYSNGATGVFVTSTAESLGTNRFEICGEMGKLVVEDEKIRFIRNEIGQLVERFRSNVTESVSDQWGNRGANEENTGSI